MSSDTIGLPPAHARREADVAARSTDDAYSHTTAHSPAVPNSCGGCRGAGREEGWGRSHSTLHVATTCTYTRNISLSLLLPECDTARTTGAGECRGARLPPRLDSTRARPRTPAHGTSVLCSQYVPRTLALAPRTRSDLLPDLTQRISPSAHAGGCLRISLGLGLATPLAPLPSSRHHLRPQLAQGSETHLGLDASDSRCNCRAHPRLLDSVLAVLVPH